jgi:hypothetical protein
MGHAFRFRADLLHKIGGREMGQQQGGDQDGTDDGFCAIQGEIPGGADEWQQGGNDTLDRKLEQFDRADAFAFSLRFGSAVARPENHCLSWCIPSNRL